MREICKTFHKVNKLQNEEEEEEKVKPTPLQKHDIPNKFQV